MEKNGVTEVAEGWEMCEERGGEQSLWMRLSECHICHSQGAIYPANPLDKVAKHRELNAFKTQIPTTEADETHFTLKVTLRLRTQG